MWEVEIKVLTAEEEEIKALTSEPAILSHLSVFFCHKSSSDSQLAWQGLRKKINYVIHASKLHPGDSSNLCHKNPGLKSDTFIPYWINLWLSYTIQYKRYRYKNWTHIDWFVYCVILKNKQADQVSSVQSSNTFSSSITVWIIYRALFKFVYIIG